MVNPTTQIPTNPYPTNPIPTRNFKSPYPSSRNHKKTYEQNDIRSWSSPNLSGKISPIFYFIFDEKKRSQTSQQAIKKSGYNLPYPLTFIEFPGIPSKTNLPHPSKSSLPVYDHLDLLLEIRGIGDGGGYWSSLGLSCTDMGIREFQGR